MSVLPHPGVSAIQPLWAVPGGRIDIHGAAFPVTRDRLPQVEIGGLPAHVVCASPTTLGVVVPHGVAGGRTSIRIAGAPGETAFAEIGEIAATGIHQVDNPVLDEQGNLYVTYSGSRGERVPVSIFRVSASGTREPFASDLVNPTSMAFDRRGVLHVSSRFEGTIYRVRGEGQVEAFVSDLGIACGLAFAADGTLFVGDRAGTIFAVNPAGEARPFATLPASVAAFHLAVGPDGALYATAPTLSAYDYVYRVDAAGRVERFSGGFGRPQGLAFDSRGDLFVVEALAGASGLYRVRGDRSPECVLSGPGLVGVAFEPAGGLIVTSNDTAWRLRIALRPAA
jgi:sugar lactone lactonase YvrE